MTTDTPQRAPAQALTVEKHDTLGPADRPRAWELYHAAFAPLATVAAQRHLLHREELTDILLDDRIGKWTAHEPSHARLAGLAVMTSDLHAWPLISPEYFTDKYPGRKVFYIGFVATDRETVGVFPHLIGRMYEEVIAADGVAVMDFCTANVTRGLPRATNLLLKSINPDARGGLLDAQQFYAWQFQPDPRLPPSTRRSRGGAVPQGWNRLEGGSA